MNSRNLPTNQSFPTTNQAQQRVDVFSKEHQNDTVPTNSNDVAELHQLTTYISLETTKSWYQLSIQKPEEDQLGTGQRKPTEYRTT
ncbi:hypothetical protein F511_28892 [Dorcoceras hygrometricum]|uniref:Uncharacterized protein n=1 Tax=Dorcoceras hygrometricum TaxID=472368 RepID=A0A2Z7CGW7_9LAMI|nr:hypothetical protein F511_28892 [Dorcoceras hygrometricum]